MLRNAMQGFGRDRAQECAPGSARPTQPSNPTPAKAVLLCALKLAFFGCPSFVLGGTYD
jgi:hypothetical protein